MTCTNKKDGKVCGGQMFKPGDQGGSTWVCPNCGAVKQS